MGKKVIIFDLDETLRKLEFDGDYRVVINVLIRPNIKTLLHKLKEVKKEGTDVLIWTTDSKNSVNDYFINYLPKEYRDVFDRIISREDQIQLDSGSIEERVYGKNRVNKPITALKEYDQILFFDDNKQERYYLRKVFEDEKNSPNKQVIFNCYPYNAPKPNQMYGYKKVAEEIESVAKKVDSLFAKFLEDPGCNLMVQQIDEFQKLDFSKGLTIDMDNEELNEHEFEVTDIEDEIDVLIYKNKMYWSKYQVYMNNYYKYLQHKKELLQNEENNDER